MDVHLAYPEGFDLLPEVIKAAKRKPDESSGKFDISNSMEEAYTECRYRLFEKLGAHAYHARRTEILIQNKDNELKELEQEGLPIMQNLKVGNALERINETTKNGSALYMHCLPADITGVSVQQG